MLTEMCLYCLSSGLLHFDQSVFTYNLGMGAEIQVPSPMFLIEHPRGLVLFETGLDPAVAGDPVSYWGEPSNAWRPILTPEQTIVPQLARLGFEPRDVKYVIMSCLIRDHAGGMKRFPDATFVVQAAELREAWWPSPATLAIMRWAYCQSDLAPTRRFRFIHQLEGEDYDVFGDGKVVALSSPCHAKGEQVVVVRLPNTGTVLLPAGVMPQRRNFEEGVLTGRLAVSPDEAYRSVQRLKRLAHAERATVLYHHDLAAWHSCRQAPAYYD